MATPLISGKSHYFTLSATNKAGLTSFLTSDPYLYNSATPTPGLVLDFDPQAGVEVVLGSSYHMSDIDVLLEGTEVGVRWAGFAHPVADAVYSVGLGLAPGVYDVVPLTPIGGGVNSYVFLNVSVVEGSTHYATVVADTGFSHSQSSSNGVLAWMDWRRSLQLATVYDGAMDVDVEYHISTSQVSAQWFFPAPLHSQISHYMWGVVVGVATEQVSGSGSGGASPDRVVEVVLEYRNVGKDTSGVVAVSGPALRANGSSYMNAVLACFATRCLPPVYSDGFRVAAPPTPGALRAVYTPLQQDETYGTSDLGSLELTWEEFSDPQLAYYEWSLGTGEEGAELLLGWEEVEWFEDELTVLLNATLSLHYTNRVTLRGYNTAGLHASVSTALLWRVEGEVLSQSSVPLLPLVVYDLPQSRVRNNPAATQWQDLAYEVVDLQDIDYIDSLSTLSGGWPDLRYMQYRYSISTQREYLPCGSQGSLACSTTFYNSATVPSLSLTEGGRYYFCVQALAEHAIHRTPATPPVLEACSNGVTVDLSAPRGGCVKVIPPLLTGVGQVMGSGVEDGLRPELARECSALNHTMFQVSTSDLYLIWEEFLDVESFGNAVHASGVASYSYAIGKCRVHASGVTML